MAQAVRSHRSRVTGAAEDRTARAIAADYFGSIEAQIARALKPYLAGADFADGHQKAGNVVWLKALEPSDFDVGTFIDWTAAGKDLGRIVGRNAVAVDAEVKLALSELLGAAEATGGVFPDRGAVTADFQFGGGLDVATLNDIGSRVTRINAETRDRLAKTVERGLAEGLSPQQLAKELIGQVGTWRGKDGTIKHSRAMVIARTETGIVYNKSSVLRTAQTGLVDSMICYDNPDCGWIGHNSSDKPNGKAVSFDDAIEHPLSHPNCVRAYAPNVEGIPVGGTTTTTTDATSGTGPPPPPPPPPDRFPDPARVLEVWQQKLASLIEGKLNEFIFTSDGRFYADQYIPADKRRGAWLVKRVPKGYQLTVQDLLEAAKYHTVDYVVPGNVAITRIRGRGVSGELTADAIGQLGGKIAADRYAREKLPPADPNYLTPEQNKDYFAGPEFQRDLIDAIRKNGLIEYTVDWPDRQGIPDGFLDVAPPAPKPVQSELDQEVLDWMRDQELWLEGKGPEPKGMPADVARARDILKSDWIRLAAREGLDPEQLRIRVESLLQAHVDKLPLATRRSATSAEKIIRNGHFKSQFETQSSGGAYAPEVRKRQEKGMFGYADDLPVRQRPIYGYMDESVLPGGKDTAEWYGDTVFVMKESVRRRTTVAWEDTLGGAPNPSPLDEISWMSYHGRAMPKPGFGNASPYIEAQIHGGLTIDDVAEIRFTRVNPTIGDPSLQAKLRELGFEPDSQGKVWTRVREPSVAPPPPKSPEETLSEELQRAREKLLQAENEIAKAKAEAEISELRKRLATAQISARTAELAENKKATLELEKEQAALRSQSTPGLAVQERLHEIARQLDALEAERKTLIEKRNKAYEDQLAAATTFSEVSRIRENPLLPDELKPLVEKKLDEIAQAEKQKQIERARSDVEAVQQLLANEIEGLQRAEASGAGSLEVARRRVRVDDARNRLEDYRSRLDALTPPTLQEKLARAEEDLAFAQSRVEQAQKRHRTAPTEEAGSAAKVILEEEQRRLAVAQERVDKLFKQKTIEQVNEKLEKLRVARAKGEGVAEAEAALRRAGESYASVATEAELRALVSVSSMDPILKEQYQKRLDEIAPPELTPDEAVAKAREELAKAIENTKKVGEAGVDAQIAADQKLIDAERRRLESLKPTKDKRELARRDAEELILTARESSTQQRRLSQEIQKLKIGDPRRTEAIAERVKLEQLHNKLVQKADSAIKKWAKTFKDLAEVDGKILELQAQVATAPGGTAAYDYLKIGGLKEQFEVLKRALPFEERVQFGKDSLKVDGVSDRAAELAYEKALAKARDVGFTMGVPIEEALPGAHVRWTGATRAEASTDTSFAAYTHFTGDYIAYHTDTLDRFASGRYTPEDMRKITLHEMLHTTSDYSIGTSKEKRGYRTAYSDYTGWEEGVVELMTGELEKKLFPHDAKRGYKTYTEYTRPLEYLFSRSAVGDETLFDWLEKLLRMPVAEREGEIIVRLTKKGLPIEGEIRRSLDALKQARKSGK